jgi:hypothetical protein
VALSYIPGPRTNSIVQATTRRTIPCSISSIWYLLTCYSLDRSLPLGLLTWEVFLTPFAALASASMGMELRRQVLPEHGELNRGEMKRHGPGRSANEVHSFHYYMQCFKTSLPFFKHVSLSVCPSPCGWQSSLGDCHSFLFPTPSSSHY